MVSLLSGWRVDPHSLQPPFRVAFILPLIVRFLFTRHVLSQHLAPPVDVIQYLAADGRATVFFFPSRGSTLPLDGL